jgi:hypothetical protein
MTNGKKPTPEIFQLKFAHGVGRCLDDFQVQPFYFPSSSNSSEGWRIIDREG